VPALDSPRLLKSRGAPAEVAGRPADSPLVGDRVNVSDARESGREKWLLRAKRSAPASSSRALRGSVTALISCTCSKEGGCDCLEGGCDCLDVLLLFNHVAAAAVERSGT